MPKRLRMEIFELGIGRPDTTRFSFKGLAHHCRPTQELYERDEDLAGSLL